MVSALTPSFIGLAIARAFQGIRFSLACRMSLSQAHILSRYWCSFHYTPCSGSYRHLLHGSQKESHCIGLLGSCRLTGIHVRHQRGASEIHCAETNYSVGLILGGVLTDLINWRWIFWISLILSGVLIPSAVLVLPYAQHKRELRSNPAQSNEDSGNRVDDQKSPLTSLRDRFIRFDVLGIFLGIPGFLVLNYALTSANTDGWGSGHIIGTLVAGLSLLALFLLHERRATVPLMPGRLFHDLSFNLTLVLALITYAVRQACTYFLTIQLQAHGNSPIHTAILFIPLGISALIANSMAGRLVPKFGARMMVSQLVDRILHDLCSHSFLVRCGLGTLYSWRNSVFTDKCNYFLLAVHLSWNGTLHCRACMGLHYSKLCRRLFSF